ncbi:hypothetical protein [Streptomyces sp. NPDC002746]
MLTELTDPAASDHVRVAPGSQLDGIGAALPAAENPAPRAAPRCRIPRRPFVVLMKRPKGEWS